LVILNQDLTSVPPETIKDATVVMTIVDGKVRFGRP
jgi:predicted amidohydrolase YtcJ